MAMSNTFVFNLKRREPQVVLPEKSTPHEIKRLSDIDVQGPLRFLIPVIFFYSSMKGKPDPAEQIRDGLAKALAFYYPFAGRMIEGSDRRLLVNCNNKGVVFVEADAEVTLEQLGDGILPPCGNMEDFLCPLPDDFGGILGCPLLFFQVTRFLCGGFALGIRLNHTMADAHGLVLFLNAISELMKGASTPSITPVWQRELLNARSPPRITCTHHEYGNTLKITSQESPDDDKLIRTSIFFGPKEIQALSKQSQLQDCCFTTYELITACLWRSRTIALEPNPDERVSVACVVHVRKTKCIQIPNSYYGNAFVCPAAVSNAETLCTRPLLYALELVKQTMETVDHEEYVKSLADFVTVKKYPNILSKWNYGVSDNRNIGFDKLDFGWGKPLYGGVPWASSFMSCLSRFKNYKGENGVVASISLPSLAVEKFRNELNEMVCGSISKL